MGAFTFNASRYYIATLALLVLVTVRAAAEKKEERPSLSREEKKSARRSSGLVASAAERRSPLPPNFQQAGMVCRHRQRQGRLSDGAVCGTGACVRSVL